LGLALILGDLLAVNCRGSLVNPPRFIHVWLLAKLIASKNGAWESLGSLNRVARVSDGGRPAPSALGVLVARVLS